MVSAMDGSIFLFLLTVSMPILDAAWPGGTWGIPMSKEGCPQAEDFKWATGQRVQEMETGSHTSDDSHFMGTISGVRVETNYCMKLTSTGQSSWQPGQYCIFKKGQCPKGLSEGYISWDDGAPFVFGTINAKTGTLPDGVYDHNTRIRYCCRTDGNPDKSIDLPYEEPFYLLKRGSKCQKVTRTEMREEWFQWNVEETSSSSSLKPEHPTAINFKRNKMPYVKVFYCYYTPRGGLSKAAIIAIAVIAALIVLAVILFFIIKFIYAYRKSKAEEAPDSEEHEVELQMMPPGRTVVLPSPTNIETTDANNAPPIAKVKVDTESTDTEPMLGGASGNPPYPILPQGEMPQPPGEHEKPPTYRDVLLEDGKI